VSEWADKGAGESDEWYTPKYVFDALGCIFDVDVAAPLDGPRYVPCRSFIASGSLDLEWRGFVWMNPPYGHQNTKIKWLRKFFDHENGIALVPDRTSAPWWQQFAPKADVILFVDGKIKFERPDGSIGEQPGNGTCLFASGRRAVDVLLDAQARGLGLTMTRYDYRHRVALSQDDFPGVAA
jgi:hypothetical protein